MPGLISYNSTIAGSTTEEIFANYDDLESDDILQLKSLPAKVNNYGVKVVIL